MRIYLLNPIDKEDKTLFPSFKKTFEEKGHTFTTQINECDTVFMDLFSGLGTFNTVILNYILQAKTNVVFFDEGDYGGCKDGTDRWFFFDKHSVKPEPIWQIFVRCALDNCKVVYFMRKMDKKIDYPSFVYPYELVMYPDHVFPPTTKEGLFNREIDITFIGNTSPTRHNVIEALKKTGLALNYSFTNETGKFEHQQWIDLHKQSKLFLSCCGGGTSDERAYQLMYISPMLRVNNNQLIVHNFRDGLDCIEISEHPTFDEINYLKKVLNDEELLYSIYISGITRMEKYFNPEYRSNYILKTLQHQGIC